MHFHLAILTLTLVSRTALGGIPAAVPGTGPDAPTVVTLTPEQAALNRLCDGCQVDRCWIPDANDCTMFISCEMDDKGRYRAAKQQCAFGTFWDRLRNICNFAQEVNCPSDPCINAVTGTNYQHIDGNCKTFWTCTAKGPEAKCCEPGFYYDPNLGRCAIDTTGQCKRVDCPIRKDKCSDGGMSEPMYDDKCNTYWDCKDNRPRPACCPPGQAYNDAEMMCMDSLTCAESCPPGYGPDSCLTGVRQFQLDDGFCRTFLQCNATTGIERWCCPPNKFFSANNGCVDTVPLGVICSDHCPRNYKEFCHLDENPLNNSTYFENVNGRVYERPCPAGTIFSKSSCVCGTTVKGVGGFECNLELDITFDQNWVRNGSENMIQLSQIGTLLFGELYRGRSPYRFDGNLVFRAKFFQQPMPKLYLHLVYFPVSSARGQNQVILSNCFIDPTSPPSLSLWLENDRINLGLVTNAGVPGANRVVASANFQANAWNEFTAIYDGQTIVVLNDAIDFGASNDVQNLTGEILAAAEGLDIGGCFFTRGSTGQETGFTGFMSELKVSKCLRDVWIRDYNARIRNLITATATSP